MATLARLIARLTPPSRLHGANGLATGPDGRLYVAQVGGSQVSAIDVDRNGNVWIGERCGANGCADNNVPPIIQLDANGKFLKTFGAGMFVVPHGIAVDSKGNVYIAENRGRRVQKFRPVNGPPR